MKVWSYFKNNLVDFKNLFISSKQINKLIGFEAFRIIK